METVKIAELLERTFQGPAWYGPSVMTALEDITPQTAFRKISNSHSIIQLVAHMTTWRKFVTKRLTGDSAYEISDNENFPSATSWEETLTELKTSQVHLLAAVKSFPDNMLYAIVPTRKYDFYTMLHGIVQHDIYHTGQIMLLKK